MNSEWTLKLKHSVWGAVGGAAIAMMVGFTWGGWTTAKGTTKASDAAVTAVQAAICAAQFMMAPAHDVKVKEFQATDGYRRTEFVEKGGWDRMPGQEKAAWGVSDTCASNIAAMLKQAQATSVSAPPSQPAQN